MSRDSDSKETEHAQYLLDSAYRFNAREEIAGLKKENEKLKTQVAELKKKLARYKDE